MIRRATVAVVVPLYNKAGLVGCAIQSALDQSSTVDEIIVVNDGSTDSGSDVVAAFSDARIRLESQANSGVSSARNRGIRSAQSEFVAFLDADDFYERDFIREMRALIERWPEAAVFCAAYSRLGPGSKSEECLHRSLPRGQRSLLAHFYSAWAHGSFTCSSAIVVRRSALLACEPMFVAGEPIGEDQDLWFRLAERFPGACGATPLQDFACNTETMADQVLRVYRQRLGVQT